jgi:MFS family permease
VAGALGPSLGGWLIDNGGWQWAFWINVPIGILSLIAGAIVLRESREDERRPWPDALGALLLMIGVGALVFGLVQTREWGWGDPRELAAISVGVLLIAAMIMRSRRHPQPILRLELFTITPYRLGNAMLFFSLSFFGFQFVSVQLLTGPWGYDLTKAGLLATPIFLCIAVMGPVSGRFTDRFGNWLLAPCALVWVLSLAVFAVLLDGRPNMALWWTFVVIGGLGSGFVWGALFAMIMKSVPPADFSNGASVTQTLQRIGNALGVAVMVTVLSATLTKGSIESFPKAFGMLAALGLVATIIGHGASRATDRSGDRQPSHEASVAA